MVFGSQTESFDGKRISEGDASEEAWCACNLYATAFDCVPEGRRFVLIISFEIAMNQAKTFQIPVWLRNTLFFTIPHNFSFGPPG